MNELLHKNQTNIQIHKLKSKRMTISIELFNYSSKVIATSIHYFSNSFAHFSYSIWIIINSIILCNWYDKYHQLIFANKQTSKHIYLFIYSVNVEWTILSVSVFHYLSHYGKIVRWMLTNENLHRKTQSTNKGWKGSPLWQGNIYTSQLDINFK